MWVHLDGYDQGECCRKTDEILLGLLNTRYIEQIAIRAEDIVFTILEGDELFGTGLQGNEDASLSNANTHGFTLVHKATI